MEGIVEWWLLEEEIKQRTLEVKSALTELVEKGLVKMRKGPDQRSRYCLNSAKKREVKELLKHRQGRK